MAKIGENFHHVLGEIASCQVQTQDCMGQSVTLVDWHGVRHAIPGIHDDACGAAGQKSLNSHLHRRHIEGLEHDLCHALSVGLGIQWPHRCSY